MKAKIVSAIRPESPALRASMRCLRSVTRQSCARATSASWLRHWYTVGSKCRWDQGGE